MPRQCRYTRGVRCICTVAENRSEGANRKQAEVEGERAETLNESADLGGRRPRQKRRGYQLRGRVAFRCATNVRCVNMRRLRGAILPDGGRLRV